jgi:L-fuculose-phosphate aldolase
MSISTDPRFGQLGGQLIRAGRRLGQSGLIAAAEGNLSALTTGGGLLITRAGARKDELRPSDLVLVDTAGRVLLGEAQASTELALHLAAYETCPEARAVVHAHPVAATAFAAAEQVPEWRALAESLASLGPVQLVPYAHPGTTAMAESLRRAIGSSRVLLLAHHGALTIGASLEQALQRMELLERLCAIQCAAAAIGGLKQLPQPEQQRLLSD